MGHADRDRVDRLRERDAQAHRPLERSGLVVLRLPEVEHLGCVIDDRYEQQL